MKQEMGWFFPDHEKHLQEWMRHPKNQQVMNGRQAYQGRKQMAVLEHCKSFRTAIDVGGHIGLWSFNLACRFTTVHAFEPVSEHRDCFLQNVTFENVHLHPVALGAEAGSVSIATEQGSSGNSCVSGDGPIPMVTLDSLELTNVDLIKLDCEGFEENVLRGAIATINAWRPVVIVEQKHDHASRFGLPIRGAVEFLKGLGYLSIKEISGDHIMVPA